MEHSESMTTKQLNKKMETNNKNEKFRALRFSAEQIEVIREALISGEFDPEQEKKALSILELIDSGQIDI